MYNLKELRLNRRKTQKQVADELNISFQSYSNYENGHRKPYPDMLIMLANYYNVSVDFLLDRANAYGNIIIEKNKLSADEQHLIDEYRKLDNGMQCIVANMISEVVKNFNIDRKN